MRCLFFPLYTHSPHLETDFELMASHLAKKDEVLVITCNGKLSACLHGINHKKSMCILCKSIITEGLKWLPIPQKRIVPLPHKKLQIKNFPSRFSNLSNLINFKYDGIDLGRAAASNLLFQLNWDHKLD